MTQIRTTHVGSLPRTPELLKANATRGLEDDGITPVRSDEYDQLQSAAVDSVVARQREIGISIPNDGEYGHAMGSALNYGSWWSYIFPRVSGLEIRDTDHISQQPVRSEPGRVRLTSFADRRDWVRFAAAYQDPESGITVGKQTTFPTAVGPLSYTELGRRLVDTDIRNLQGALGRYGYDQGFLAALAPGSASRIPYTTHSDEDEFIAEWVPVLREEYRAITDAGLIVQVDDPSIAENYDQINPEPSIDDYLAFTQKRIDAINAALEGIPAEQVRFHLCWGSWHGPHTTDIGLREILPLLLQVNARYYSFEAANARHAHEWKVWHEVEIPADKVLLPGVVSHSTNVVEHPELVRERIGHFTDAVGPDRVIASTDCGLGGRIHPDIAWAKLESLVAGAALASDRA